jgi:hypothetical protein
MVWLRWLLHCCELYRRSDRGSRLSLGLAIAAVSVPAHAQTTTIDFSSLAFDGDTALGPRGVSSPLNLNGYTLTATDPFGLPPILVYSSQSTNSADMGGAAILENRNDPGITITRTDGGLFSFNGLDLTYAYNDQNQFFGGGMATFTFNDGAFVETRSFDNLAGFQTFNFDMSNLTSVRISGDSPFQIDNVRLTAAAAVPEPGTWAMMLIGFGGVGYSMRRKRSTAASLRLA